MTSVLSWANAPGRALKKATLGQVKLIIQNDLSLKGIEKVLTQGMYLQQDKAADLLFRLFDQAPERLEEIRDFIMGDLAKVPARHPRWAYCKIAPHLVEDEEEALDLYQRLHSWLGDSSAVVQILCLEGMWELTTWLPERREEVLPIIKEAFLHGKAGVRVRSRKLLARAGLGGY